MTNRDWLILTYARGLRTYEQFVASLHWYCPPGFYPPAALYHGEAREHWHAIPEATGRYLWRDDINVAHRAILDWSGD